MSPRAAKGAAPGSSSPGPYVRKSRHHFQTHFLTEAGREAVLEHLQAADAHAALESLKLKSKGQLKTAFCLVYRSSTRSDNKRWLQRRLTEALGLDPAVHFPLPPRRAPAQQELQLHQQELQEPGDDGASSEDDTSEAQAGSASLPSSPSLDSPEPETPRKNAVVLGEDPCADLPGSYSPACRVMPGSPAASQQRELGGSPSTATLVSGMVAGSTDGAWGNGADSGVNTLVTDALQTVLAQHVALEGLLTHQADLLAEVQRRQACIGLTLSAMCAGQFPEPAALLQPATVIPAGSNCPSTAAAPASADVFCLLIDEFLGMEGGVELPACCLPADMEFLF